MLVIFVGDFDEIWWRLVENYLNGVGVYWFVVGYKCVSWMYLDFISWGGCGVRWLGDV